MPIWNGQIPPSPPAGTINGQLLQLPLQPYFTNAPITQARVKSGSIGSGGFFTAGKVINFGQAAIGTFIAVLEATNDGWVTIEEAPFSVTFIVTPWSAVISAEAVSQNFSSYLFGLTPVSTSSDSLPVRLYFVITATPIQPSVAQIVAGQDSAGSAALFSSNVYGDSFFTLDPLNLDLLKTPEIQSAAQAGAHVWFVVRETTYLGVSNVVGASLAGIAAPAIPAYYKSEQVDNLTRYHRPENILVLVIQESAESNTIADYYIAARKIPVANKLVVSVSTYLTAPGSITNADFLTLYNAIWAKIAALPYVIRGLQLCGDWPVGCSYWIKDDSGWVDPTIIMPLNLLTHLMWGKRWKRQQPNGSTYGILNSYVDYPAVPSPEGIASDSLFVQSRDASLQPPYRADRNAAPFIDADAATVIPARDTQLDFLAVSALPTFNQGTGFTTAWIDRGLAVEAAPPSDFGNVVLVDTVHTGQPIARNFIEEASFTGHSLSNLYYVGLNTKHLNPKRQPVAGDGVFKHAGTVGYQTIADCGLYSFGNLSPTYASSYYAVNVRPTKTGERTLRDGAVAAFTQSSPLAPVPAASWDWGQTLPVSSNISVADARLAFFKIAVPTFPTSYGVHDGNSNLRFNVRGGLFRTHVVLFAPDSFASASTAISGLNTLTVNWNDGSPHTQVIDLARTMDAIFSDIDSLLLPAGWMYQFSSVYSMSHGYQAIRDGACFAYGCDTEPRTTGMAVLRGVVSGFHGMGLNVCEWMHLYQAGARTGTEADVTDMPINHQYLGDLLFAPLNRPASRAAANYLYQKGSGTMEHTITLTTVGNDGAGTYGYGPQMTAVAGAITPDYFSRTRLADAASGHIISDILMGGASGITIVLQARSAVAGVSVGADAIQYLKHPAMDVNATLPVALQQDGTGSASISTVAESAATMPANNSVLTLGITNSVVVELGIPIDLTASGLEVKQAFLSSANPSQRCGRIYPHNLLRECTVKKVVIDGAITGRSRTGNVVIEVDQTKEPLAITRDNYFFGIALRNVSTGAIKYLFTADAVFSGTAPARIWTWAGALAVNDIVDAMVPLEWFITAQDYQSFVAAQPPVGVNLLQITPTHTSVTINAIAPASGDAAVIVKADGAAAPDDADYDAVTPVAVTANTQFSITKTTLTDGSPIVPGTPVDVHVRVR